MAYQNNSKKWKREKKTDLSFNGAKCVIGIDQSYTRTGISICVEGKLKKVSSVNFKGVTSKSGKRMELQKVLKKAIEACLKKYEKEQIVIIAEYVRTFTATNELRPAVIKAQSAMLAYIVDTAYLYGIEVYSVDTRHWKSRVLGSSQPIFEPIPGVSNPQKFGSVKKVLDLGMEDAIKIISPKSANGYVYDDDAADSACIALYGFSGEPYRLYKES